LLIIKKISSLSVFGKEPKKIPCKTWESVKYRKTLIYASLMKQWIPAFAGMTDSRNGRQLEEVAHGV
jgi:hypothetical protein